MKKKMRKKLFISIAVIIIVLTIVLMIVSGIEPKKEPLTFTVDRRDIITTEGASGTVGYDSSVFVYSSAELPVDEITVSIGDTVKKGEMLFSVDTSELSEKLSEYEELCLNAEKLKKASDDYSALDTELSEQSRKLMINIATEEYESALKAKENLDSQIAEYKSNLEQFEQQLNDAYQELKQFSDVQNETEADDSDESEENHNYERVQKTIEILKGRCETYSELIAETQQTADEKGESIDELKYELEKASSEDFDSNKLRFDASIIEGYHKKIDEIKTQIDSAAYYSPIDGIVTDISIEKGMPCGKVSAMTISDSDSKCLNLLLRSEKRRLLETGMRVVVSSDTSGAETINGTIEKISDVCVDNKYTAKINISNEDKKKFFGGEKFFSRIITSEKKDVLAVPYESIDESEGKYYVYLKNGKHAERKEVTVGLETDYYTEITGIEEKSIIFLSAKEGKACVRGNDK